MFQVSKEWKEAEENYLTNLLMAKFSLNPDLAKMLFDTEEKQLHEASGDRNLGIGSGLSSKALSTEEWKG